MLERQSLAPPATHKGSPSFRPASLESLEPRLLLSVATGGSVEEIDEYNNWSLVLTLGAETQPVIEGSVYDYQTSSPLEGIQIDVYQGSDPDRADMSAWDHVTSAFTDVYGHYQIANLTDRAYHLNVPDGQTGNDNRYVGDDIVNVSVVAGTTAAGMDFELHTAGSVVGHVYDSLGNPLEGIQVVVEADYRQQSDDNEWHSAWTGPDGGYEIFLLQTDREVYPVKIAWSADAYGNAYEVQIAPGLYSAGDVGTAGPDFQLAQGAWLEGYVQTSTGLPLANCWNVLAPAASIPNGIFEDPNVQTDQTGRFRVPVPAMTDLYMLTAGWNWDNYQLDGQRFAWGERWIGPFSIEPGGTLDIGTLIVPQAVSLSGTVTDPLGNPIPGVEIGILGTDIYGGEIWLDGQDAGWTDGSGQYSLDWLPAGQFTVMAWAGGYVDYGGGVNFDLVPGDSEVLNFVMTPADQGASVGGSIANFSQVAPSYNGQVLPYEVIDYNGYALGAELGVVAFDHTMPWEIADMLLPNRRFTGQSGVEDGFGDYLSEAGGQGTYQLTIPASPQTIFAYRSLLNSLGGWYANLSDGSTFSDLEAGAALSGQDLLIPLGDNAVTGEVFFPEGYEGGNLNSASVHVSLHEADEPVNWLGRAVANPGPAGLYAMEDIPDGDYYVLAAAEGLARFVSQTFTVSGGAVENVDILFEFPFWFPADLAFDPPAETSIHTEIGSIQPVPFDMVNLGEAEPGQVEIALYLSQDQIVNFADTPLTLLPPGAAYPNQWAFVAPETAGTYYIAAVADPGNKVYESNEANNWSQTITLELTDESQVTQFAFADYFPLAAGAEKLYSFVMTGPGGTATRSRVRTVVGTDPVSFGGAQTTEVRKFLDGRRVNSTYYTFDESGLHIHGQSQLSGASWSDVVFADTLVMCPADISLGMVYDSVSPWSGPGWTGSYHQQATVVGFEEIVTSAGTYNALRLHFDIDAVKSSGEGASSTINDSYDAWLAEDVGVVHEEGVWTETKASKTSVWTFRYDLAAPPSGGQVGGDKHVDLIARFDESFIQPSQLIPGQRVTVPVVVQNMGADAIDARVALELLASRDQFLDEQDFLLSRRANLSVSLAPGASRVYNIWFTVPDGAAAGPCFLLANVDADNVVIETLEDNNVASSGLASQYAYQFGNLGGTRNVSLTMLDQFGTPVTFSLRGGAGYGYGEVARGDDGGLDVTYHQTDDATTATIRSPFGTNGVVGNVYVLAYGEYDPQAGDTVQRGCLKSLNANGIDLTGDLAVEDWIGSVQFDDVATPSGLDEYDHIIRIGAPYGLGIAAPVKLTFGSVGETSILSELPISRLTASEWIDSNETRDRIVAPRLDALIIRGDRSREMIGHFGADLVLNENVGLSDALALAGGAGTGRLAQSDIPEDVLGSAKISGDLYGAQWRITGSMGDLAVRGRIENAVVRTSGSMGAISFGGLLDSDFLAGINAEVARRATARADIVNGDAFIESVTMRSGPLPGSGESPFFQNGNFSAGGIGRVSLLNLMPYNSGVPFGFAANWIASISNCDTETGQSWTWHIGINGQRYLEDFLADALLFTPVDLDISM